MTNLFIRPATSLDAAKLLAIYAPYVEKTTITFEYTVPTVAEFSQRVQQTLEKYPYLVAETKDGDLLGYAYAGAYNKRAAYDWAVATTVYVKENCPIKGVGTQLYQALEQTLARQHVVQLLACITAGNQRSEQFHQKFGYQYVGKYAKVGFKFDRWCDVVWMQKTLNEPTIPPQPIIPFSTLDEQTR